MNISSVAGAAVSQRLLRRAKLSWLGYGALAYVGLRVLRRYDILSPYPDRILNFVDQTVYSFIGREQPNQRAQAH